MSSPILSRQIQSVLHRSIKTRSYNKNNYALVRRFFSSNKGERTFSTTIATEPVTATVTTDTVPNNNTKWERSVAWIFAGAIATASAVGSSYFLGDTGGTKTSLDAAFGTLPLVAGPITIGSGPETDEAVIEAEVNDDNNNITTTTTKFIEEPETRITFPPVYRSKHLLGLGVRKKFQFVNVYAVGFYANKGDIADGDDDDDKQRREDALLNPHKHRIIRIVMNRTLTMETVINALLEALEPRMHGRDLFALEEFSKMRSYGSLQKGEEIILTIQGDSIECWCSNGGKSSVKSEVFTRAVCDVYFGKHPISPAAKASVMKGISTI